jgi:uncharacterized membrane protein YeiH
VPHPRLTLAISILEAIATLAFAISGFIEARKNRLDSVGTFVVALATAFGGGTLRDILLERRPFYWVVHDDYVIAIFVLALFAPFVLRMLSRLSAERLLLVADAIGLGIFSISGTAIALDAEMPRFIAVMMGVITGVVGGIVRDVLCNDIPLILRDSRPMRPARSPAAGSICCSHGCSTTRCTACCSRPASFSSRGWRRSNSTCGCRTDIVAPHPMPCRAGAENERGRPSTAPFRFIQRISARAASRDPLFRRRIEQHRLRHVEQQRLRLPRLRVRGRMHAAHDPLAVHLREHVRVRARRLGHVDAHVDRLQFDASP